MATIFKDNINYTYSFYLPTEFLNYKYLMNINNDYVDLCDREYIGTNQNYNYIRVYNNREGFCVLRSGSTGNYNTITNYQVHVTDDFFARRDSFQIMGSAFIFIFVIILIFNCVTEFISKGGLFKWA